VSNETLDKPWSSFQQFGSVCDSVMAIRLRFIDPKGSIIWWEIFEKMYGEVLSEKRYRLFFRASMPKEARRAELRRLLGIGTRLLLLRTQEDESYRSEALAANQASPVDTLLSGRNRLRQMESYMLMLAYPMEQVLLLTDDEIVQAVRIVENSERLIPWDTLFRFVDGEVDDALISVILGGSHG
jgi:hypothetical protein